MWIALQSWASEGGLDRQEVLCQITQLAIGLQILTELVNICCFSAQEVKRLLPLVRFNLMDTQFFRQDMFDFCYRDILTFGLRRVVRFNPLIGPEVEEEVERLFYTRTPAR